MQAFGTNCRFYLVDTSFGELFAFVFLLSDLGQGRGYFKTRASQYFSWWDLETLAPVSAALGALSCLPEYQAVALRWRLLPHFRFFAARPPSGEPSPGGVLRPHPAGEAGDAHAAPPVLRVWPVEELRMARPAPAWRSPVAPGPEAWEDCWRGRWGEGAAPRRRPSPGVADPRRSQLAQRHGGRRFPEGLCGTLLPGDRRSGNQVYDVIAPADQ